MDRDSKDYTTQIMNGINPYFTIRKRTGDLYLINKDMAGLINYLNTTFNSNINTLIKEDHTNFGDISFNVMDVAQVFAPSIE